MFLALDIGNVLCKVDFSEFITELCANHEFKEAEVWDFLLTIQPLHDLGIFKIADELRLRFGVSTQLNPQILEAWNRSITMHPVSAHYLKEFLDSGVNVALLSNMGHEHRNIMANVIGPDFDRCVQHMSCDVGARKPTMIYYQSFLMQNPGFHCCPYVDDRPENNAMASKLQFVVHPIDLDKMNKNQLIDAWELVKSDLLKLYKDA